MIGSVIDKYEVLQKLGEGATATVYRGRHIAIGKDVAIKILHPHLSASTRNRERFNREARAVGRLSHQNIVSILDYSGQTADDCYIVTELVDGVTALDLLQEHGHLPSEIAILLAIELCSALSFAHIEGVIHRDIKPENVMIRRDGKVKLMDFGVARVLDEGSITIDGSLLGSPAYMSPQQALDQPLDGRSDLFSLGTVLFHLVTGHVPFAGSNASIILRNIIESNRPEVLELAPVVSPGLAAIIDRLLQPNPEDRFPTAAETGVALVACLADVGLTPDHPTLNLRGFLVNPDATLVALDTHLRQVLLERGRERLARNDHLGALQLFNRLLAIDEENAEVLALIQSLHQPPAPERRPRWIAPAAAMFVLVLSAGGWWALRDSREVPTGALATTAEPAEQEESEPPLDLGPPTPVPTPPAPLPSLPLVPSAASVVSAATRQVPVKAAPVATAEPAPPASTDPGRVVVSVAGGWGDVYVDNVRVGRTREGPRTAWVATRTNPLSVTPGTHTLMITNPHAEPHVSSFTVVAGETVDLGAIELRRLPVTLTINPNMPRDCTLSVGGVRYGTVAVSPTFPLFDPDPATEIVFECPTLGTVRATLGATRPGDDRIVPTSVPAAP